MSEDPFETFRKNAKVDDIIECTVKNIKEYGVFVKLNETVDGFIHISNLSSSYVKNPNEVVSQGDVITARIISINEETQKVELTMNLNPDAEETVEEEAVVEEVATEEAPVGETATEDAVVEETVAEEAPTEETVTE